MYLLNITYITGDTAQELIPTKEKLAQRITDLIDDVQGIKIERMQ